MDVGPLFRSVYEKPRDDVRKQGGIRESDFAADLAQVIRLDAIRDAGLAIGADPLGGASVQYWEYIADTFDIEGLEVYAYAPGSINPPALVPGVPTLKPAAQGLNIWSATMRLHLMVPSTVTDWQAQLEELLLGAIRWLRG